MGGVRQQSPDRGNRAIRRATLSYLRLGLWIWRTPDILRTVTGVTAFAESLEHYRGEILEQRSLNKSSFLIAQGRACRPERGPERVGVWINRSGGRRNEKKKRKSFGANE